MCQCTPEIRTPFCGRPGCEWPEQKPKAKSPSIMVTVNAFRCKCGVETVGLGTRHYCAICNEWPDVINTKQVTFVYRNDIWVISGVGNEQLEDKINRIIDYIEAQQ